VASATPLLPTATTETTALPATTVPTATVLPATATRLPATMTPVPALMFVPVPGRPTLLEFYEEGCGPCVIMQEVVYDLHGHYGDQVTFASAEIFDPAAAGLVKQYRARGTPFIVLLGKDGQTAHRIYGVVAASELTAWLDRLLE
jgi:thiol-disulfide isomerase/thioredoxin